MYSSFSLWSFVVRLYLSSVDVVLGGAGVFLLLNVLEALARVVDQVLDGGVQGQRPALLVQKDEKIFYIALVNE